MPTPFCECQVVRTPNGLRCSNCGGEIEVVTERAAIIEFDANVTREEAERMAFEQIFGVI